MRSSNYVLRAAAQVPRLAAAIVAALTAAPALHTLAERVAFAEPAFPAATAVRGDPDLVVGNGEGVLTVFEP